MLVQILGEGAARLDANRSTELETNLRSGDPFPPPIAFPSLTRLAAEYDAPRRRLRSGCLVYVSMARRWKGLRYSALVWAGACFVVAVRRRVACNVYDAIIQSIPTRANPAKAKPKAKYDH